MKAVICDDNKQFARSLQQIIENFCAQKDLPLDISIFNNPKSFLEESLDDVQVVFLDIDMPEINGIDAAKIIREHYPNLIIVFVTAYIEYAPAGYKVNAFRYILKDRVDTELEAVMEEIYNKLYSPEVTAELKFDGQEVKTPLNSIMYFEGTPRRMVLVHFINRFEPIECSGKLSQLESDLKYKGFLRIQKSFLVNMRYIKRISGYKAIMSDNTELKTSESDYSRLCGSFLSWKGKNL